jgi:hypothetical protein
VPSAHRRALSHANLEILVIVGGPKRQAKLDDVLIAVAKLNMMSKKPQI